MIKIKGFSRITASDFISLSRATILIALVVGSIVATGQHSVATPIRKVGRLLSERELNALQSNISPRVIELVVRAFPKPKIRFVGPRLRRAKGYLLTERHLLSASAFLELGADESRLSISARCHHGVGSAQAKDENIVSLKQSSPSEGWAIFELSTPLNCRVSQVTSQVSTRQGDVDQDRSLYQPKERAMFASQVLYAYEAPPKRPAQVIVEGKASEPMSFYWLIKARLHIGTPLFYQDGTLATIVGMPLPMGSGLLPSAVIQKVLETIKGDESVD